MDGETWMYNPALCKLVMVAEGQGWGVPCLEGLLQCPPPWCEAELTVGTAGGITALVYPSPAERKWNEEETERDVYRQDVII